jgi:hypothetical protein
VAGDPRWDGEAGLQAIGTRIRYCPLLFCTQNIPAMLGSRITYRAKKPRQPLYLARSMLDRPTELMESPDEVFLNRVGSSWALSALLWCVAADAYPQESEICGEARRAAKARRKQRSGNP